MRISILLAATLLACGLPAASALADELPESATESFAAIDALSGLVGEWITVSEVISPDGAWTEQSRERALIEKTLRGLSLSERPVERLSGDAFEIHTYFSFDQYRDVYRLAVIDDTWGLMDIYEGEIVDGYLVVTNLRADTNFPIEGGAMNFKLSIPVAGDMRVMTIDRTVDRGESWQPFYRVTYSRTSD